MNKDPYKSITFGNSLSIRVDGAIGAMSLSPNGRDAVLAGRRGLFIIDLDDPFTTPRWLHHITSWEVADVQWSPHHSAKPSWCISTSNQKALLWDLSRPSNDSILNVLHEHTRAITDINFHPSDPEVLATCSIDTFVSGWDLRTPRKPVYQWAEWRAGATQVKWNHDNPYEIASSHDHNFYIWDTRMGALPVMKIDNAHGGKINGIDFSYGISNVITCSNDGTIKFWDLSTERANSSAKQFNFFHDNEDSDAMISPSVVIETDFPVARARNLPFGSDKACGIMPLRNGDDSIHIVNYDEAFANYKSTNTTQVLKHDPIYSFSGHSGPIKDFLWRTRHENYDNFESKSAWKDYQLVTWSSSDYDLKLWPHNDSLYNQVNYNPGYQKGLNSLPGNGIDRSKKTANGNNGSEVYNYETYCIEPPLTLSNILAKNHGDMLTSLASFQIGKRKAHSGGTSANITSELNHLDWISGIRMGRPGNQPQKVGNDDTPSNLGEEISIVANKFPKVKFEKISVSTGELLLSLRGILPAIETSTEENEVDINGDEENNEGNEKEDEGDEEGEGDGKENGKEDGKEKNVSQKATSSAPQKTTSVSQKPSPTTTNGVPMTNSSYPIINDKPESEKHDDTETQNQEQEQSQSQSQNQNQNQGQSQGQNQNQNHNQNQQNPSQNPSQNPLQNSQQLPQESEHEQKLVFIRLEVNFPKNYPFLETIPSNTLPAKKQIRFQKNNIISFDIEETHELKSEVKTEMIKNLTNISEFYSNKHQKFCLEPLLRYLMGEKVELQDDIVADASLETISSENDEIIQEVGTEGWADDLINQQPDSGNFKDSSGEEEEEEEEEDEEKSSNSSSNTSSDEENEFEDLMPAINDDELGHSTGSLSKSGITTSNDINNTSSVNNSGAKNMYYDSTPVPKGCGAVWGPGGQLVCFFIPKKPEEEEENKVLQKFSIFKFTDAGFSVDNGGGGGDSSDGDDNGSHSEVQEQQPSNEEDNEEDDDNSSDTSTSSNDSFSNDWDDIFEEEFSSRFRVPGLFKTSVGLGNRYIGDRTKRTTQGGTGSNYKSSRVESNDNTTNKKKKTKDNKKNTNIIGVFDFSHLIPDKPQLAHEYRLLGDIPENLARYNSQVAHKYGLQEISGAWKLLEMVLVKDIEINNIHPVYFSSNILNPNSSIAKNVEAMNHLIQVSETTKKQFNNKNYRFYWGTHPFGHSWLVREMMNYFESRGNLQMVVMLSCVLYENKGCVSENRFVSENRGFVSEKNGDVFNVPMNTPYQVKPQIPSVVEMKHFNEYSSSNDLNKKYSYYGSASTERSDSRPIDGFYNKGFRNSSTSVFRRDTSNSYARSITSTSDNSTVRDESPDYVKKNLSMSPLIDTNSSNIKQNLTYNELRKPPKSTIQPYVKKSSSSKHQPKVRPPPTVSIEFHNTDTLDLFDDIYTKSLLDSQQEEKLKLYRHHYANMLYYWGLPINRIKIMKFNYPNFNMELQKSNFTEHECSFGQRDRPYTFDSDSQFVNQETRIPTTRKNPWIHKRSHKLKYCNLCNLMVNSRLVICINCEHVLHSDCALNWWEKETECPSGCGCHCLNYRL